MKYTGLDPFLSLNDSNNFHPYRVNKIRNVVELGSLVTGHSSPVLKESLPPYAMYRHEVSFFNVLTRGAKSRVFYKTNKVMIYQFTISGSRLQVLLLWGLYCL